MLSSFFQNWGRKRGKDGEEKFQSGGEDCRGDAGEQNYVKRPSIPFHHLPSCNRLTMGVEEFKHVHPVTERREIKDLQFISMNRHPLT
jgi:hypothetical protein